MSSTGRGPRLGGEDDFYVTPAWCVRRLLEAWKPAGGIWLEPSAGNGAIIRAVRAARSDVSAFLAVEVREEERATLKPLAVTIIGDFLTTDIGDAEPSVVIGNPPFSLAQEFIERARKVAPNADVCMLLRLNFAGSEGRAPFMRAYPPDIYLLPNRPSFVGGKTDSIEYAWFVWPSSKSRSHGEFRVLASTSKEERKSTEKRQTALFTSPAAVGGDGGREMTNKFVYFIRAKSGPVKIGYASDPYVRLRGFQCGSWDKLKLIGVRSAGPGSIMENSLHEEFAMDHIRGEWFRFSDYMAARIREMCGDKCYLDDPVTIEELNEAAELRRRERGR